MKVIDKNSPCNNCKHYFINCALTCKVIAQYLDNLYKNNKTKGIKNNE